LKRTIVNRIHSSICWAFIQFFVSSQIIDLLRFTIGPLPTSLCNLGLFFKHFTAIQVLLFFNAAITMKYLSIFWLSNPFGFQDDFWSCFLNRFVIAFSFLGQCVVDMLPSTQPMYFYICTGSQPLNLNSPPSKPILPKTIVNITVVVYCIYCLKVFYYKFKHKSVKTAKLLLLNSLENKSLSDLASNVVLLSLIILHAFASSKLDSDDVTGINEHPAFFYFAQVEMMNLFVLIKCFLYYLRHQELRVAVFREIKESLNLNLFQIKD
jgi:hypothetical protein